LPAPSPQQRLDATVAILGTNQSRSSVGENEGGGYSSGPPGHWMTTKLFLGGGEGEVFLNLNEAEGAGEFSIKDPDYATTVVTELAKLLLPMPPAA
jgi:hypothetical protein